MKIAGLSTVAAVTPIQIANAQPKSLKGKPMKAIDIQNYLRSLCEVDEPSVDRVIIGDPEQEVRKIGTAWMPYWKTCKDAVAKGVNVMVVHEPTFYTHWDLDKVREDSRLQQSEAGNKLYMELVEEKAAWIRDQGLTIIRCHDVLDKVPEFGIPFAFGEALGFTAKDILRQRTYYNVYRIEPQTAQEAAQMIAAKLKALDQSGVGFYGDPDSTVRSIGVGTGCHCNPIFHADMEPDLFVAIDDSLRTWTETVFAEDTGRPLVVVNHGTSEEPGMRKLSKKLQETFPDYEVIHLPQGCGYRWITV